MTAFYSLRLLLQSANALRKPGPATRNLLFLTLLLALTSCHPRGVTKGDGFTTNDMGVIVSTKVGLTPQDDYPELPPLQFGASYSPRMESVRRIAAQDEASGAIERGSYAKVVAQLTQKNLLYQQDPEGHQVACIPLLAAMIDRDARRNGSERMQEIFDQAYADGLEVTKRLFGITQANGFYLDGLENAVKAASHINDKARRWLKWWREEYKQPEATVEDVAASFNDLVRYSALCDKARYVEATLALIDDLKANGFEIVQVDNRFLDKEGRQDLNRTYRAVHLTVRSGERLVEIQVHDYSSREIREYTHEIYEKMRQLDEESDEYKRMSQQCVDAWKDYANPEGIERIR